MTSRSLALAIFSSGLLVLSPDAAALAGDQAIFSLANKDFTLVDVAGVSEADLLKRFHAETRNMTLADLLTRLDPAEQTDVKALSEGMRRSAAEAKVYRNCRRSVIGRAINDMTQAKVAEGIVREHEIAVGEYFEIESMRTSIRRFRHYLRSLYTDIDQKSRDEALFAQVSTGMISKEAWLKVREDLRATHVLSRWRVTFCLASPLYEDVSLYQFMAQPLLQDVCSKGSYSQQAAELAIAGRSLYLWLKVDGYAGERTALDALARELVKDGEIQDKIVGRSTEILKATAPGVAIGARVGYGTEYMERLVQPRLGEFREVSPGVFALAGLVKRYDPASAVQSEKEAYEMSAHNIAFRIAAREYMPALAAYEPDLPVDYSILIEQVRSDAINPFVPEVDRATYRRKVFPATLFDATRSSRPILQSFAVRAAIVLSRADRDAAVALREEIARARQATASAPARKRFDALDDQLRTLSPDI